MNELTPSFYDLLSGLGVGPLPGPFSSRGNVRFFPFAAHRKAIEKLVCEYDAIGGDQLTITPWTSQRKDCDSTALIMLGTYDYTLLRPASNTGLENSRTLFFRIPVKVEDTRTCLSFDAFIEVFPFFRTLPGVLTAKENRGLNATLAQINVPRNRAIARSVFRNQRRFERQGSIHAEDLLGIQPLDENARIKDQTAKDRAVTTNRQDKVFLTLTTGVSDEVAQTVQLRDDVLIELLTNPSEEVARRVPNTDGAQPKRDYKALWQDYYNGVLRKVLTGCKPETILARKQVRDARDQRKANYQSLIMLDARYETEQESATPDRPARSKADQDLFHCNDTCTMRIYDYFSHPLAYKLGLSDPYLGTQNLAPEFRALSVETIDSPVILLNRARYENRGQTLFFRRTNSAYIKDFSTIPNTVIIGGGRLMRN